MILEKVFEHSEKYQIVSFTLPLTLIVLLWKIWDKDMDFILCTEQDDDHLG